VGQGGNGRRLTEDWAPAACANTCAIIWSPSTCDRTPSPMRNTASECPARSSKRSRRLLRVRPSNYIRVRLVGASARETEQWVVLFRASDPSRALQWRFRSEGSHRPRTAVTTHPRRCRRSALSAERLCGAETFRLLGRYREAVQELNKVASIPMPPPLRSRFLHLKSLLLGEGGAPQALEHLLESYEQDRLRGDGAGVAISLLAIARIFADEHEYERARQRIREALPLADKCGLVRVVASLALLAEIDLAEGKATSAETWLAMARGKFSEDDDEDSVAHVTRMLDTNREGRK
jgi:hypothetical protein